MILSGIINFYNRNYFKKVKQSENKEVFSRLTQLMSPNYLKEDDDFFKGKVCLDAGCGSHAWTTYSMLKH